MSMNFDDLLKEIQEEMGPAETNSEESQMQEAEDDCLRCTLESCGARLNFPVFPENAYFAPAHAWMFSYLIPLMQKNQRCLVCALRWTLNSQHPELTILDIVFANTMSNELHKMTTLPQGCIHASGVMRVQLRKKEDVPPDDQAPEADSETE